jgi:amidase
MVKPAQAYNIVTIKPTTGLVSRANCIPLAEVQDTIGPMTGSVEDAAEILTIIAGKCLLDPATLKIPFDEVPKYRTACKTTRLDGFRLGVPTEFFKNEFSGAVLATFTRALSVLEHCGATIVHGTNIPTVEEYINLDLWSKEVVMHTEFKTSINRYLESLSTNPHNIKNLKDLINVTKAIPEEEADVRGLELWEAAQETDPSNPEYIVAQEREKYLGGDGGISGAIKAWKLDALLMPSVPKQSTHFAMFQGTPMITVPLGFYPADQPLRKRANGNVFEIGPNFP